jgi:hypothetical protein
LLNAIKLQLYRFDAQGSISGPVFLESAREACRESSKRCLADTSFWHKRDIRSGNTDRVPHETYMQIAGHGQRIKADYLREAIATSNSLHQLLLAYVFSFMTQTTQTALANGRSKIEERLARWLLMARDRVDSDELPLTHEFLAIMLGVRRSGVTVALQELERKGLIAHRRSVITIGDREGLEHSSNGTYSPPNDW